MFAEVPVVATQKPVEDSYRYSTDPTAAGVPSELHFSTVLLVDSDRCHHPRLERYSQITVGSHATRFECNGRFFRHEIFGVVSTRTIIMEGRMEFIMGKPERSLSFVIQVGRSWRQVKSSLKDIGCTVRGLSTTLLLARTKN